MKKITALLLALMLLGLAACTQNGSSSSSVASASSAYQTPVSSSGTSLGGGNVSTGNDEDLETRMARFAAQTTASLLDGSENACYSPFSLYTALAMLSQGAEGETLDELLTLLLAQNQQALSADSAQMMQSLQFSLEGAGDFSNASLDEDWADPTQLSIANSAWLAQGYAFSPAFSTAVSDSFNATLYEDMDFADPATGQLVSDWIAANTGGLLGPNLELAPETVLALINTVYLADAWTDVFYEQRNTEDVFHLDNGSAVNCTYMNKTISETFYIQGDNYVGARLGLADGQNSRGTMGFILPDEGVSAAELLSDPDSLFSAISETSDSKADVVLQLPKFSFDSSFSMVDFLTGMGVQRAFDETDAQLLGLVEQSANNLFVSQVKQETHISIDEQGVEAAAYTAIGIETTAAPLPDSIPTVEVILDRPFLFFISYNGIPVFVGVVANPAA